MAGLPVTADGPYDASVLVDRGRALADRLDADDSEPSVSVALGCTTLN